MRQESSLPSCSLYNGNNKTVNAHNVHIHTTRLTTTFAHQGSIHFVSPVWSQMAL